MDLQRLIQFEFIGRIYSSSSLSAGIREQKGIKKKTEEETTKADRKTQGEQKEKKQKTEEETTKTNRKTQKIETSKDRN